jgi:hypothetical protein
LITSTGTWPALSVVSIGMPLVRRPAVISVLGANVVSATSDGTASSSSNDGASAARVSIVDDTRGAAELGTDDSERPGYRMQRRAAVRVDDDHPQDRPGAQPAVQ